jgi:hypothetical protein
MDHLAWRIRLAVAVIAALAASGFAGGRVATAGAERVALIWNAPAACPPTQSILDEVERTGAGSGKEIAPVAAVVNVLAPALPDGRWAANMVVHSHGKRAERLFQAESCMALASAAALIIGLAAEDAGDSPPPAGPAGAVPAAAQRADTALAATSAPGLANPGSGWKSLGPQLLVGGILDSGTMPDAPAMGVEAAAGASWASSIWRLRLATGATFFPTQDLPNQNVAYVPYGRYWLISFSGRGCLTAMLHRFELGPCVGGELVFMNASIDTTSMSDTQYWASPLFSAVAALTVASRLVVFARTDLAVPTTHREFHGLYTYEVYKLPSFALRGAVGLELRFF